MEVILPLKLLNGQKFLDCASKLAYDEFSAKMFVFCTESSDVDVFELMGNQRLMQLVYGWEVCQLPNPDGLREDSLRHVVKVLAHHSLQLWFSQEWSSCSEGLKRMLLYYLGKATSSFAQIEGLSKIDWPYILRLQGKPWRVPYLQQLFANLRQNKHHNIEHSVLAATHEDITFLQQENLNIILLRLIQLFNAGNFEAVKQLSLKVLAAWLKSNANSSFESLEHEQTAITLVGHLYLLTIFVMDENRGYVIDNMMYNIRFYALSMQEAPIAENINFTPARLIAQVCVRLRLSKSGFFEQIVFKKFKLNLVTSFAVMLEAYTSYVLGNQLLELMALNEHDFLTHLPHFKVLMYRYVEERENSETFLLNELQKLESQRNSHAKPYTVNLNLNYQQQICKGNRASNIGNYKNCDDDEKPLADVDEELDRQIDPVFQNVPNNEEVLHFVYKLLAQREFRGWQFAKIALLLKIIGQQLNAIEIWRYHPGLTTDFMLNLEHKLSNNYADLAKVFSDHGFMEAEFWLTAFYLHPTTNNYNEVKRCSRIKKKRFIDDEWAGAGAVAGPGGGGSVQTPFSIKYELLSSTIDVDEIVAITNHSAPVGDYEPIYKALQALRLPRSFIKDLLTVIFQPRNKRYSWALEWSTLQERCNALLKSKDLKNKFVALNMAEANDRLEYLKIDYAKYKDRPQLDYGTIEEGYENAANLAGAEAEVSADEKEEEPCPKQPKKRKPPRKFWDEVISEDEEEEAASDESEAYYTGSGRRTRIRAAAIVANAMLSDMDRSMRSGRRSPPTICSAVHSEPEEETEREPEPEPISMAESEPPKSPSPEVAPNPEKRSFGDLLDTRTKFSNETSGFKAFADIWNFKKEELQDVTSDTSSLRECSSVLNKFRSLQILRGTAPATCKDGIAVPRGTRGPSETDSVDSETSTMAMHDSTEEPCENLFGPDEKEKEVSQETGTGVQEGDGATTTAADLLPETTTQVYKNKRFKTSPSSNTSSHGEESTYPPNDDDDLTKRLIQECLTRTAEVRLNLLTLQDLKQMRECRVRIKRTDFVSYFQERQKPQRKRRKPGPGSQIHSYSITTDSNASTPTFEIQKTGKKRVKKFVHITSDSPRPSSSVMIPKKIFRHITSDSSTDLEEVHPPAPLNRKQSGRRVRGKMRVKELQVRICRQVPSDRVSCLPDVIELSSDSHSSSLSLPRTSQARIHFSHVLELDPLYEEEIVPF
ncbi:uncharacterized protein LOC108150939 isoform X2 [Drosophila miranda]|uniref:uncharacterized protein LOC108150939 isoform X2 n=1 Tax=Drosophila miranda TaxID=7229 RepID=UPI0007E75DD3|nr:uncharacterized protein LOC108150939 isoform X2 [Drosophila miranda]